MSSIPTLIDLLGKSEVNNRLIEYIISQDYGTVKSALMYRLTKDNQSFQDAVMKQIIQLAKKYPDFKDYLLTEVRLSPNDNVHIIGVRSFGALKFDPALPLLVDELLKNNRKLNQAVMDAIYMGFQEDFVRFCLKEIDKGGPEITNVSVDFLKSVDPQFTVIPLIENLESSGMQRNISIDLLKKIGDKGISSKLQSVDNPDPYKKILYSEPELTKIVDKLTV